MNGTKGKSSDEASELRKALLDAVDDGLLALGESVRNVMYHHVKRKRSLRREEIPERLEAFHEVLDTSLGAGARVIERLVAEKLYSRLDLKFVAHESWTLVNYVDNAKKDNGDGET